MLLESVTIPLIPSLLTLAGPYMTFVTPAMHDTLPNLVAIGHFLVVLPLLDLN